MTDQNNKDNNSSAEGGCLFIILALLLWFPAAYFAALAAWYGYHDPESGVPYAILCGGISLFCKSFVANGYVLRR